MFGKVLSVEREFVGVRIVEDESFPSEIHIYPENMNFSRVSEDIKNAQNSEIKGPLRVFYHRNFFLFGKSIRNTLSEWLLPPKDYSFDAFVYRTMWGRILN